MSKSMPYVFRYADGQLPDWATEWTDPNPAYGERAWPVRPFGPVGDPIIQIEDGDDDGRPKIYSAWLGNAAVDGHLDDADVARGLGAALLEAADVLEQIQAKDEPSGPPTASGMVLRALRTEAGLTLGQVAAEAGVSAAHLSRAESGAEQATSAWLGVVIATIVRHLDGRRQQTGVVTVEDA